jgi:hypothetical protein
MIHTHMHTCARNSDPVEIMVSNFKRNGGNGPCLRTKKHPPESVQEILGKGDASAASRVADEDYCAAHLAMLCNTALEHIQKVGGVCRTCTSYGLKHCVSVGWMTQTLSHA